MPKFPFTGTPGFNVEMPDNTYELYFLKLFFNEEIIASLTLQTNKYAVDFIQANNAQKFGDHSRFSEWPKDGIKTNKMLALIALAYYMGIVKKDLIILYWSIESTIEAPWKLKACLEMNSRTFLPFFIAVTIVNMLPQDGLDTILRKSLVLVKKN